MDRATRAAQTRIGTIGSSAEPLVDGRGRVTPGGHGDWLLDWWVGADDRWHLPADEAAVRQGLLGHAPVVETRLRVPGGDAVHRAYGVRGVGAGGGQEYVVVEVENDSPVPFALALVVRPALSIDGGTTAVGVGKIDVETVAGGAGRDEAQLVRVDGRAAMFLPRAPARAAAGESDSPELSTVVTTGRAGSWPAPPAADDACRRAAMAFVLPVTHHTTLRVLLPVGPETEGAWPAALPSVDQVVKGWTAQAERGPHVELPDPKLMALLAAARRRVLLHGPDVDLLSTYDRLGHHGQVTEELKARAAASSPEPAGHDDVLDALVTHWRLTHDRSVLEVSAWILAGAVNGVAASARRVHAAHPDAAAPSDATCRSVARAVALFAALGDPRAAHDTQALADQMLADLREPGEEQDPGDWTLQAVVADAGPSSAWIPPCKDRVVIKLVVANLWCGVADDSTDGQLALLAHGLAPGWYGQPIDIRDLPTAAGRLSFAVRWHGDRPALLWELAPHAGSGEVTITAPGLDPTWRSTEARGEALLAPVAAPVAVTQEAVKGRSGGPVTSAQPPRSVWPLVSSVSKDDVSPKDDGRPGDGDRSDGTAVGRGDVELPEPGASFS